MPEKRKEEKREQCGKMERFAWLGPMMERRKVEPEPADEPEEAADKEEKSGK
jgi:hypothetical protein